MAESLTLPKTTIELPVQYRYLSLPTSKDSAIVNTETREVTFAFSSEAPTKRVDWDLWEYIYEVLSHDAAHCNLDRCNSGAAPLLWNHNRDDQRGVVTKAWIETDRRAWCTVRFSRSADAEQLMLDVNDSIVSNVSLGYRVFELELTRKVEGDLSTYTATNWEVLEVSFCSIPADPTVGIGRSQEGKNPVIVRGELPQKLGTTGEPPMPETSPVSSEELRQRNEQLEREVTELRQQQQQQQRQQSIRDRFGKLKDQGRTLLDTRKLSTAAFESMFSDAALKRYLEDGNTELDGVEFHLKQQEKYASAPANLGPQTVNDVPLPEHPNERSENGSEPQATPKADGFLETHTPRKLY